MEEENIKNVQIKQEYLVYGLAAALIVIIILIGSLLYIISTQNSSQSLSTQDVIQQLPEGHVPISPGATPGPLDETQLQQFEQQQPSATGATETQSETGK